MEVFVNPNIDCDTLQQSSCVTENEISLDLNVYQEAGETLDCGDHGSCEMHNVDQLSFIVETKPVARLNISKDSPKLKAYCPDEPKRKKIVVNSKKKKAVRKSNYPCPNCSYVGASAKLLRSHKYRICLTKPTPCPVCNKMYKNRMGMKKHMKYLHSGEQYKTCEICDKSFTFYSYMQHLKVHKEGYDKPSFVCEFCSRSFTTKYSYECHKTSIHPEHDKQNTTPVEKKRDKGKYSSSSLREKGRPRTYKYLHPQSPPGDLLVNHIADSDTELNKDSHGELNHKVLRDQDTDSILSDGETDDDLLTKGGKNVNVDSVFIKSNSDDHELIKDSLNYTSASSGMVDSGDIELPDRDKKSNTIDNEKSTANKMKILHKKGILNSRTEKRFVRDTKLHRNDNFEIYACPNCDYVGNSKKYLDSHLRRSCLAKPMPCPICNKMCKNKSIMKKHIKYLHPKNPFHTCKICNKTYTYGSYVQHMKVHKEGYKKPSFLCEFCSKTFTSKHVYQNHINSFHLGLEYPKFLCSFCGKSFKSHSSLKEHINTHTGDQPFVCETCGKSFKYSACLRSHKKFHHDDHFEEKAVKCEICNKTFKHPKFLRNHMKIHKKEFNFSCRHCGKKFDVKSSLKRHEKIHDGILTDYCKLCNMKFNDASIVRRHIILVHKSDKTEWKAHAGKLETVS